MIYLKTHAGVTGTSNLLGISRVVAGIQIDHINTDGSTVDTINLTKQAAEELREILLVVGNSELIL